MAEWRNAIGTYLASLMMGGSTSVEMLSSPDLLAMSRILGRRNFSKHFVGIGPIRVRKVYLRRQMSMGMVGVCRLRRYLRQPYHRHHRHRLLYPRRRQQIPFTLRRMGGWKGSLVLYRCHLYLLPSLRSRVGTTRKASRTDINVDSRLLGPHGQGSRGRNIIKVARCLRRPLRLCQRSSPNPMLLLRRSQSLHIMPVMHSCNLTSPNTTTPTPIRSVMHQRDTTIMPAIPWARWGCIRRHTRLDMGTSAYRCRCSIRVSLDRDQYKVNIHISIRMRRTPRLYDFDSPSISGLVSEKLAFNSHSHYNHIIIRSSIGLVQNLKSLALEGGAVSSIILVQ